MLTISHLALALPRATAFTAFRRRFQPRVVLRGTGTEQLGAVAAPGVRVRAPWTNGQLYPGQVTSVEGDTVSIKFDDGDQREGVTWKHCQVGAADDLPRPAVGVAASFSLSARVALRTGAKNILSSAPPTCWKKATMVVAGLSVLLWSVCVVVW